MQKGLCPQPRRPSTYNLAAVPAGHVHKGCGGAFVGDEADRSIPEEPVSTVCMNAPEMASRGRVLNPVGAEELISVATSNSVSLAVRMREDVVGVGVHPPTPIQVGRRRSFANHE